MKDLEQFEASPNFDGDVIARAKQRAKQTAKEIINAREEILGAFIAKHGFDPDHAVQLLGKDGSWQIVEISEEDVAGARMIYLLREVVRRDLSWWQKLCIWMASGRWPK